jgi:hypothetical protein
MYFLGTIEEKERMHKDKKKTRLLKVFILTCLGAMHACMVDSGQMMGHDTNRPDQKERNYQFYVIF